MERHFTASEKVRDVVIGMSDGLTVPFALAAGLSGAVHSSFLVIAAGLAEIAAGSMAMGLGGYLAARTDAEHYHNERLHEREEIMTDAKAEAAEVRDIFATYGVAPAHVEPLVAALAKKKERWVDLMMRLELGLEEPDPRRSVTSAVTIAVSYVVGGLVPLSPYFVVANLQSALLASIGVTLGALFVFGCVKGHLTGASSWRSGAQTMLVGGAAAAAAFFLARVFAHPKAG